MDTISKSLLVKLMRLGSEYLLEAAKLIEEENDAKIENIQKLKSEKSLNGNNLIQELPLGNDIINKEPEINKKEIIEENSNKILQKDQESFGISSVIAKTWKSKFLKNCEESPSINGKSAKILATPPKAVKKVTDKKYKQTKFESQTKNKSSNSENSENSENSDTDTEQDESDSVEDFKFIRKQFKPNE